jgi:phage terminase large subunit
MYKAVYGGRGSGKSWAVAKALIKRAVKKKELILCFREYQTSIKRSSKSVIERQIKRMGYSNEFQVINDEIRHKETGSIFFFAGIRTDSDKVKSAEGITIAWGEEADKISQQSWDDLDATLREDGAEVWLTWNPRQDSDPIHRMFVTDGMPDAQVHHVNYDQNPHFPERLKKLMEWDREKRPEFYQHRWLGKTIINTEANVFNGCWRVDGSIEPGEGDTLYYGADFGFAKDPSALIRCWADFDKRELYVDYEAYEVAVEIDHMPDFYDRVPDSRQWEITADNARPETISYLKRNGFKMKASKKGPGSVDDGIEFLKSFTIVVHERCKYLIDELGLYSYKVDPLTDKVLPKLVDDHNHLIDSLRYALEQLMFKRRREVRAIVV